MKGTAPAVTWNLDAVSMPYWNAGAHLAKVPHEHITVYLKAPRAA